MSDSSYSFEKNRTENFRSRSQTAADLEKLKTRLELDLSGPAGEFVELLEDLVINCHLLINWYQHKAKRLAWMKRGYFLVSLVLLAIIPLVVFKLTGVTGSAGTDVTAQITVVLTGLIAFQRGISAWMDDRKLVGSYAKAAADLKREFYGFEQRWENRAVDSDSNDEFESDIRGVIARAREIENKEQEYYFQNLSYPSLDVSKILGSASTEASTLTGKFTHPSLTRLVAAQQLEKDSQRADALVTHYRSLLNEMETEMADLRASGASHEELANLNRDIQSVVKKLRSAQIDAAEAKPVYAGN